MRNLIICFQLTIFRKAGYDMLVNWLTEQREKGETTEIQLEDKLKFAFKKAGLNIITNKITLTESNTDTLLNEEQISAQMNHEGIDSEGKQKRTISQKTLESKSDQKKSKRQDNTSAAKKGKQTVVKLDPTKEHSERNAKDESQTRKPGLPTQDVTLYKEQCSNSPTGTVDKKIAKFEELEQTNRTMIPEKSKQNYIQEENKVNDPVIVAKLKVDKRHPGIYGETTDLSPYQHKSQDTINNEPVIRDRDSGPNLEIAGKSKPLHPRGSAKQQDNSIQCQNREHAVSGRNHGQPGQPYDSSVHMRRNRNKQSGAMETTV